MRKRRLVVKHKMFMLEERQDVYHLRSPRGDLICVRAPFLI